MKKTMSIAALVLMSSAALFANGNKEEQDDYYYGRGPMGGGRSNYNRDFDSSQGGMGYARGPMEWCYDEDGNLVDLEEVSVEGTLVLEEGTMPYLNTADGNVFLMVPPFMMDGIDLEGGEDVKATGYDMPTDRWGNETESVFLRVLTAEINGVEIEMDFDRMGRGGRGGRGGRYPRGPRVNS